MKRLWVFSAVVLLVPSLAAEAQELEVLRAGLNDKDTSTAMKALAAATESKEKRLAADLSRALERWQPDNAAKAAGKPDSLQATIARQLAVPVLFEAVRAVGAAGGKDASRMLVRMLDDEWLTRNLDRPSAKTMNEWKWALLEALVKLGRTEYFDKLVILAKTGTEVPRSEGFQRLAAASPAQAREVLVAIALDTAEGTRDRIAAIMALRTIADKAAAERVNAAFGAEADFDVHLAVIGIQVATGDYSGETWLASRIMELGPPNRYGGGPMGTVRMGSDASLDKLDALYSVARDVRTTSMAKLLGSQAAKADAVGSSGVPAAVAAAYLGEVGPLRYWMKGGAQDGLALEAARAGYPEFLKTLNEYSALNPTALYARFRCGDQAALAALKKLMTDKKVGIDQRLLAAQFAAMVKNKSDGPTLASLPFREPALSEISAPASAAPVPAPEPAAPAPHEESSDSK